MVFLVFLSSGSRIMPLVRVSDPLDGSEAWICASSTSPTNATVSQVYWLMPKPSYTVIIQKTHSKIGAFEVTNSPQSVVR
jgi:hypothetical protein